jgi:CRISPR-associated endonuclease Csy4
MNTLFYVDLQLRHDLDFSIHHLMSALYAKFHRALAVGKHTTIGVCFPKFREGASGLGDIVRLIGPSSDLEKLMHSQWLEGMQDHTQVSDIKPVPANAKARALRRVQTKSNPERLRRRQMKRHGLSHEQVLERIPNAAVLTDLPFVSLSSASTQQKFRLFLRLDSADAVVPGTFNAYGLSATATLPWF